MFDYFGQPTYFSQMTYNMCNPNNFNMFQTLDWSLAARDTARSYFYQVPVFDYSRMTNPMNSAGYAPNNMYNKQYFDEVFNTIMSNTLSDFQEWKKQQINNGGMYPWLNNSGVVPQLGGGNTPSPSNDDAGLSNEEKTAKKQFDKLSKLMTMYRNTHNITDDALSTELNTALTHDSKETYIQSYTKLKAVYVKINKLDSGKALKETLTLLEKDGDILEHDYKSELKYGGYDYSSYSCRWCAPQSSVNIDNLHTKVKDQEVETGQTQASGSYYSELPISNESAENSILEILSAWNNTYGSKDDVNEKSIIRIFTNKLQEKNFSDITKEYIKFNIKPFTDGLRYKANYSAKKLEKITGEDAKKLNELATELNTRYEKLIVKESYSEDALNDLVETFDKLYVALRLAEAKNAQKTISDDFTFLNGIDTSDTDIITEDLIIKETIEDLRNEGFSDDEINEIQNIIPPNNNNGTQPPNPNEGSQQVAQTTAVNTGMRNKGKNVQWRLCGYTFAGDTRVVNDYLSEVNKNNVYDFLHGYYIEGGALDNKEGLIEHLDDDNTGRNTTMENKKRLIKAFLDFAKEKGLNTTPEYKEIERIYELYKTGRNRDCKEFNETYEYATGTQRWFNRRTDNEVLDYNIKFLFKELQKQEENKTAHPSISPVKIDSSGVATDTTKVAQDSTKLSTSDSTKVATADTTKKAVQIPDSLKREIKAAEDSVLRDTTARDTTFLATI